MFNLAQKAFIRLPINNFLSNARKINFFSTQETKEETIVQEPNKKEIEGDYTIFIANVSRTVKDIDLLELLRAFGNPIMEKPLSTRSTGRYAFVSFDNERQAKNALKMNGVDFMGSPLKITLSKDKPKLKENNSRLENRDPSKCIYVGNLSYLVSETLLWDLFSKFGKIEMIRLNPGRFGHKFAFVQFSNQDEAKNALMLNSQVFQGKTLNVKPSVPSKSENKTKSD